MKSSCNLALILFLAVAFMVSCNNEKDSKKTSPQAQDTSSSQDKKSEVVFYINDRPVSKGQLVGPNLDSAISNEVIYEMAVKQNLDKDESILNRVEQFKKNIITSKIKSQVIKDYLSKTTVTDEQIEAYYEEIKHKYATLDLTQIMLDDEETANAVYAKIANSDNVDDTLEEQKKAGVKIITKKLKQTKHYDRFFKDIKEGELSNPVKGKNKYNIYKIDTIEYTPLEQIKQQLQYQLTSKNRSKAIDEYVKKSIAENNIKIKKVN
jgi:foldase protein PrsA